MPPSAKRAKTSADSSTPSVKALFGGSRSNKSLEADDMESAAHALIDLAKAGKWEDVFRRLDAKKELVNVRPAVREYGVLHQAAFHGNAQVFSTLVKNYGADLELKTKHGQSVLQVAEEQGHVPIVEILSPSSAAAASSKNAAASTAKAVVPLPSLTPELITLAHQLIDHAKAGRWQEVFKMLDSRKELVNVRPDVREYSALHQAAYHDNKEVLVTLITKYGADPSLLTGSGATLLQVAETQGCSTVIESLQSLLGVKPSLEPAASKEDEESDHDDPDLEMKQMSDGSWKVVQKSTSSLTLDESPKEVSLAAKIEPMATPSSASGSSNIALEAVVPSKHVVHPVDKYFPKSEACRVYSDGDAIWHCSLKRGNQFCVMQLLEISHESFCVWTRWGKMETEGQHDASYFVSPELAIAAFKSKFFEKTNNKWENRHEFKQFFAKFSYTPEPGLEKHVSALAPVSPMPIPALTEDTLQQAHKLIDLAKAGRWADLFKMLEMHRTLVNVRPEVREYSVLHQAAFQGASDVSLRLVDQCGADPGQPTKYGKSAAAIAEEHGHTQLAEKLRERIAKHVSVAGG